MKWRMWAVFIGIALLPVALCAQEKAQEKAPVKLLLLFTEQNIGGPQRAWWASEIDLSIVESSLAAALSEAGFQVVDPEGARPFLQKEPAYRVVRMRECDMTDLANLQEARYVIKGRAIASQGSHPPQSGLHSYFARVTAKVIRVKDHVQVLSLSVWGKSLHADAMAGGSEALEDAGRQLAAKLIQFFKKEGVR